MARKKNTKVKGEGVMKKYKLTKQDINSEALKLLTPRERLIIECYYGLKSEPMTLRQIGKMLYISGERVRQIKKRAEEKLSLPLKASKIVAKTLKA